MKRKFLALAVSLFLVCLTLSYVLADDDKDDGNKFPKNATFTTLITLPRPVEGLTGDSTGNLYVGGSTSASPNVVIGPPCPIWKINLQKPSLTVVGQVPASLASSCGFSGIAFDELGNLYQADGTAGRIYVVKPAATIPPPDATIFAQGVPGTNGLAFDRDGNLWTGDGTTGQGRVWKITGPGANCAPPTPVNCVEVFRIQPMAATNIEIMLRYGPLATLGSGVTAVGRDIRGLPLGAITPTQTSRNAAVQTTSPPCPSPPGPPCVLGSQPLVANGIAFDHDGDTMFIIDTARGALWKVEFDRKGNLKSPTGCDPVFTANTLCLSNIFVAHAILEGGDGIALDKEDNVWVDANERNAVAVVTKKGDVFEIFRTPVNTNTFLRNEATNTANNNRILEFPTSPFLSGKVFCTSQSDGDRRDNSPRSAGEVNASGLTSGKNLGKISCMDQELKIPGLPLPIH